MKINFYGECSPNSFIIMRKDDKNRIGQRYNIKREGKKDIEVNLYIRNTKDNSPLLINIHGGAFISGDADTLDTQSERISKQYNVHVVTVNYKLLSRGINIEYQIEEIIDTIKFFYKNHTIYKVDPNNIFVLGYSAGGCLAMSAALKLIKMGIKIKGQILCYAYTNLLTLFNKNKNKFFNFFFIEDKRLEILPYLPIKFLPLSHR